jgi:hypothetical protein
MKTDVRQNRSFGSRIRMFVRILGMTAFLAAGAGAVVLAADLPGWSAETINGAVKHQYGMPAFVGAALLLGGGLVTLFALIVEVLSAFSGGSGRKGAAGVNAAVQVALAAALVVAVNVYAFLHNARFDLTADKQFTLPPDVVAELQTLKSETTIVVLQQHKTFGQLSAKPDRYDYAAERKVVEKVQDLVDQFRKLGPQFKVVVLDVEEPGYDKKLEDVTKDKPKLRDAIHAAPENSIFVWSEGRVQRLSFNEFFQLDKHASKAEPDGRGDLVQLSFEQVVPSEKSAGRGDRGNLVLYPQGVQALVRRITAVEERRPKVAVAVTHEALTTKVVEGNEELTLAGLRKSLTDYGFDVVDVVLKKNYRREFEGDPASFTYEETKLARLEIQLDDARDEVRKEKRYGERLGRNLAKIEAARGKPIKQRIDTLLDALGDMTRRRVVLPPGARDDEELLQRIEQSMLGQFAEWHKQHLQDMRDVEEDRQQLEKEFRETRKNERAIEDLYLTDVKAKFTRLLDDCDLLIVPRLTILNATSRGGVLPKGLHKLDRQQTDIIKDFMKKGKPIFVCAGPTNYPTEEPAPANYDDLEAALADRGFDLARQTVIFNVEGKAFREKEAGSEFGGTPVKIPPLSLTPPEEWKPPGPDLAPNPIATAMRVLLNSVDQPLDVRVRAPRPVTVSKIQQEAQHFAAEFLWTSPRSWNETYPFNYVVRTQMNPFNMQPQQVPTDVAPPRLDTGNEDGKEGRRDEERRGPFGIAACIEGPAPASWYGPKEKRPADPPRSRVAVIGHGGIFTKPELNPATEKLLLVTCNWLLGREERLPHAAAADAPDPSLRPWKYPRVTMSDGTKGLWHWGTFLGLPALFVYLGLIVLMLRRVR